MSSSPLSIRKLTKVFEPGTVNEKLALDHLDLEVPAGQFITVLGSNGSGKTTLLIPFWDVCFRTAARFFLETRILQGKRTTNGPSTSAAFIRTPCGARLPI